MAAETAAEKKAREQKEKEREEREEHDRALYEEYGLDYDNEDHRQAVAVRRLARRLDEKEEPAPKKRSKGLFG